MDELLFNDEGVVTVALLGFLRREGMARKVMTVGIIPIEDCCWQTIQFACTCIVFIIFYIGGQIKRCVLYP